MSRASHNTSGRTYIPRYDNGALEQRVYAVEKGQTALGERIDEMGRGIDARLDRIVQKIDQRAQPQYQAIAIFVSVLLFVCGGVYTLLNAANSRLDRDITNVNANLVREVAEINARLVPRAELEDRRALANQRTERIEEDLLRLQGNVFPREVHLERWNAFTAELDHIREEQKAQREQFNQLYPATNVLQNVLARIERLESRWIDQRTPPESAALPTITR